MKNYLQNSIQILFEYFYFLNSRFKIKFVKQHHPQKHHRLCWSAFNTKILHTIQTGTTTSQKSISPPNKRTTVATRAKVSNALYSSFAGRKNVTEIHGSWHLIERRINLSSISALQVTDTRLMYCEIFGYGIALKTEIDVYYIIYGRKVCAELDTR